MPLLRAEAEKLSENQFISGIVEEIITVNEMFEALPFVGVNGKAYVYNRENALPSADYLDPYDEVNESAATFTEVVAKLKILIGDVDVDKFLMETMSDANDQLAIQIAAKAKAVARIFQNTVATGDEAGNAKTFNGIAKLVTGAQTLTAGQDGAAMTLSMLDQLIDQVPYRPDFLMMRSGTRRAYWALVRASGGTDAVMIELPNFGKPVLTHNGIPIIINDYLPGNETQGNSNVTCSIYAVRANEMDGLHGLYGGAAAGIRVETIGTVQNKDALRTRLKWYCGLALKSTKSLARLKGITNI